MANSNKPIERDINEIISEIRDDINKLYPESSRSKDPLMSTQNLKKNNKIQPINTNNPINADSYKNVTFKTINADEDIDESIKNMRMELKQTYDVLINARNSLEQLNFGNLKHRIKDLNLEPTDDDIERVLKMRPFNRNDDQLRDFMKNRLNQHPGEFGDIPEVKSFFQTCNQLQHSLENIAKQSENFRKLECRIKEATQDELDRAKLMQEFYNNHLPK